MAVKWMPVADAAKVLGVSERTVRRRVQDGLFDRRVGEGGRTEVRLPVPDATASAADASAVSEPAVAGDERAAAPDERAASSEGPVPPTDAASHASAEAAATPNPRKFGRYSPLGASTPDADDAQAAATARSAASGPRSMLGMAGGAKGAGPAGVPENDLQRYQRLAGASMILAQRQADEAHEKVMLLHSEANRLRRACRVAWAGAAVVQLVAMAVVGLFGHSVSQARAELEAQKEIVSAARVDVGRISRQRNDLERMVAYLEARLVAESDELDEASDRSSSAGPRSDRAAAVQPE